LLNLILLRNGNENGFIEATADEFDLPALSEDLQARKIFGPVLFDPGEKRAGIVQTEMDAGMFFEALDEGKIASVVSLFEDVLEIAAGLMGVDEQSEVEFLRHGDLFFP
jgi:hypothetical protein